MIRKISILAFLLLNSSVFSQQQYEFCNNFIQDISFITGQDEGIEQNLDDNFNWMQEQGYTNLRYFGIYSNGYHTFPSPTLDANNYPSNAILETYLETIVNKANQYDITINFDGLEVISGSNFDTTQTGFGYITEQELADVVEEVLSLGVTMLTEEQFGSTYLQAIQNVTSQMGAIHETTAGLWWPDTAYADEQLASVFAYYHYNQEEVDSIFAAGSFPPANLGNLHVIAETANYYDIPFSIAVGSFGTLQAANWKNVLLFSQILHQPKRFSIEEENTDFCIWNANFNFEEDVGEELNTLKPSSFSGRPIVNLIMDAAPVSQDDFYPAYYASEVNTPVIVNAFTGLGYKVISTKDTFIPGVDYYYLLLTGGSDENNVTPLPAYVETLLNSDATVFIQPAYGIPDVNDSPSWPPLRAHFGLPGINTQTLTNTTPSHVSYNSFNVLWGGAAIWLTPIIEQIPASQINTSIANVLLEEEVINESVALIIQNGNKYLINSNIIHLESSYIIQDILDGPSNLPTMANIAINNDKAAIFAEYDSDVDVNLPWDGATKLLEYNPQGDKVSDTIINLPGNYVHSLNRGQLVLLFDHSIQVKNLVNNEMKIHCFPNPFLSETNIHFELTEPAEIKFTIYNIQGIKLYEIYNRSKAKGKHKIHWAGLSDLKQNSGNGIFIGELQLNSKSKKQRYHTKIFQLK